MRHFAQLFIVLDQTTQADAKVAALAQYFALVEPEDKLWAVAILSHQRPKRTVNTTLLRSWGAEVSELPDWLFEQTYQMLGDLAETIANILPTPIINNQQSLTYWIRYIQALSALEEADRKTKVIAAWEQLSPPERFVFNKFITGGFRIGLAQKLMVQALSKHTQVEENILAHRLMGNWTPETTTFQQLILEVKPNEHISKPYPFYLANALEKTPESLGDLSDWQIERKWDGIRGQIIVRKEECFVWSREEELISAKFPEFHPLTKHLPDGTVLDGEIMPFKDGQILPFHLLQTRIGRKNITKTILQKIPAVLIAYDLLEYHGQDIRDRPLRERRQLLEKLLHENPAADTLLISDLVEVPTWNDLKTEREKSRAHQSEGLILKRKSSPYQADRQESDWWKWKVAPLCIDAVLIYAQKGQGQGASLFSNFTFAVWDEERLVPFTKAAAGLSKLEINEITAWVSKNIVERFGPVRSVTPHHVFEITFEGIQKSSRHKSGVALRSPRINRWYKDKPKEAANTLADLQQLLGVYGNTTDS